MRDNWGTWFEREEERRGCGCQLLSTLDMGDLRADADGGGGLLGASQQLLAGSLAAELPLHTRSPGCWEERRKGSPSRKPRGGREWSHLASSAFSAFPERTGSSPCEEKVLEVSGFSRASLWVPVSLAVPLRPGGPHSEGLPLSFRLCSHFLCSSASLILRGQQP